MNDGGVFDVKNLGCAYRFEIDNHECAMFIKPILNNHELFVDGCPVERQPRRQLTRPIQPLPLVDGDVPVRVFYPEPSLLCLVAAVAAFLGLFLTVYGLAFLLAFLPPVPGITKVDDAYVVSIGEDICKSRDESWSCIRILLGSTSTDRKFVLTDETDSADLYKQNARLKIIYIPWLPNMKPFYWLTEPTEPTNYGILVVLVPFYESGLGIGIYLMIHVTAILRHLMTYRSKNH